MPNYHYKCCKCAVIVKKKLPISTDPSMLVGCECGYTMKRIIVSGAQFPEKVGKVFAADWFKKQYGHELGERDVAYASEQAKLDKLAKRVTKEQMDGKNG